MSRKAAKTVEVSPEEHEQANQRYKLAMSGMDEAIQNVRESRAKVRRIFLLQEFVHIEK